MHQAPASSSAGDQSCPQTGLVTLHRRSENDPRCTAAKKEIAAADRIARWLLGQTPSDNKPSHVQAGGSFPSYKGQDPAVVLQGEEYAGSYGNCLRIERRTNTALSLPARKAATQAFFSELRLLYGVGRAHCAELMAAGYSSIPALANHPRWGESALSLLDEWQNPLDAKRVHATLSYWLPVSHSLFLQMLGLMSSKRILFFDLETLGLSNAPIILAAIGLIEAGSLRVVQYLARSIAEEMAVLEQVGNSLEQTDLVLSYNGKSFDWTYLKDRFAYYGMPFFHKPLHIDLLHHARRAFRGRIPDARLGTVEEMVLGVHRDMDLPSEAVPAYYTAYLDSQDPGPLVPIVNHNRQDIVSLARLLSHLLETTIDAA